VSNEWNGSRQRTRGGRGGIVTISEFVARFPSARRSGSGWSAKCPVSTQHLNGDKDASFTFGEGTDGRVLVHCFLGCTAEAIVAAMNLTLADLMPDNGTTPTSEAIKTYQWDLKDAAGNLIAQHFRKDYADRPKQYWFSRNGQKHLGGLPTADLPLYRTEQVSTWDVEKPIILTEGEKACDELWRHGYASLATVTGASGTPSVAVLEILRGRHVILWPDNDEVGRKHMDRIGALLQGIAASVRLLSWGEQPKDDAFDFFNRAKGTTEQLDHLIEDAPVFTVNTAPTTPTLPTTTTTAGTSPGRGLIFSDSNAEMTGIDWLWYPRLARGKLHTLEGDGGLGKGTIAADVIARFSRAEAPYDCDWDPRRAVPLNSIIISAEDSWSDTIKPRLCAAGANFDHVFHVAGVRRADEDLSVFDLAADMAALERAVVEKGVSLVFLDPLDAFLGKIDPNKDTDVRQKLTPLTALLDRTQAAGLSVRHHSKAASGIRAKNRGLHSVAFSNAARIVLTVGEHPTEPNQFAFALSKTNIGPPAGTLLYRLEEVDLGKDSRGLPIRPVRVVWLGTSDLTADDVTGTSTDDRSKIEDASEFLRTSLAYEEREAEWLKVEAKKLRISPATLRRAKKAMGVRHTHSGYQGKVLWFLPDNGTKREPRDESDEDDKS
jgi:hypothetical protein